jgi:hypothetical protein
MVKGEAVMAHVAQWYANERPSFSFYCPCGLAITGQSEKGLRTLVERHKEKGIFHQEIKGETIMPVPGGEITTTEILVPVEPVVEEVEDDLPELS